MNRKGIRAFEMRFDDPTGGSYFYVALADRKQRARVARKVGLPKGQFLLALRHFWIARKYQGKGVGAALLKRLMSAVDALGLPCALYVHPYDHASKDRQALVKFYEKAGFKQIGVAKGDEWHGDPIMVRGLV